MIPFLNSRRARISGEGSCAVAIAARKHSESESIARADVIALLKRDSSKEIGGCR